jgi:hypothetical protein
VIYSEHHCRLLNIQSGRMRIASILFNYRKPQVKTDVYFVHILNNVYNIYNSNEQFASYAQDTHRTYKYAVYIHVLCSPHFQVLIKIGIFQQMVFKILNVRFYGNTLFDPRFA